MYTDYNVCAKVIFNSVNNHSKLITLYPLANSSAMAKDAIKRHILREYDPDYIVEIKILHAYAI